MRARVAALLCALVALGGEAIAQCPAGSQPPVAQSPNGGNLNASSPITFSWTPSTSNAVTGYSVFVATTSNTNSGTIACSATAANASSCTVSSLPVGQYFWAVKATTNTANCELASAGKQFTVGCLTSPPAIQSPFDSAQNVSQTPTMTWSAAAGADQYDVYFGAVGSGACTGSPVFTTSSTTYNRPNPLDANTSYEWRVVAKKTNTTCPFTTTGCATFKTAATTVCNPPGSFNLIGPANNSTASATPTLSWTAASGADKYLIHFGTQNPPSPTTNDTRLSSSQTSFTFAQPLPAGTYFWSVDAFPTCSTSTKTSSSVFSFTVAPTVSCPTTPTTLISPASGATSVLSPVTFQWAAVSGAIGYKLFIAAAGDTAGDLSGTTTATSLSRLVPDGAVTWWVATMFANCPDIVSTRSSFTSGVPVVCGTAATLTLPADNTTVTSPVTFSWSAVAGASDYRLWVSFNGSAPLLVARTSNSNTSQQMSLASGTGEWYVETQFSNGCDSTFSAHRHFTVGTAANCDTHKAATLTAPTGGAQVTTPITFSWNATDSSALLYRVWVSINGDAFGDIGFAKDTHIQHDFTATGNGLWFVETFFENCPSVKSAVASFVIPTPGCLTTSSRPQLISPSDGATVPSPVTLSWTAVPKATEYRVYASFDGGETKVLAKTTDTSITGPLSPGAVTWLVEAVFDGCPSLRSATAHFTVARAQVCPTDGPTLLAPTDGSTNLTSPVRFAWSAVNGAIGYAVLLRNKDGAETRIAQTTQQTEIVVEVPDDENEWWVIAFVNGCTPVESKHFHFTVPENNCDGERPILFTPAEGATGLSSPVRFEWSRIPNASGYKVWAAVDDQGESVVGTTTDHKLTVEVPSGTIRWRVEVLYPLCPSLSSARSSFTVLKTQPPCTTPGRPLANGPAQVASNSEYTIRWSTVSNATSYELQESATTDFSAATTQVVSDQAAKFNHVSALTATKWFYRVRAISSCSDDRGPYSPVVIVTVLPDTPQRQTSVEIGTQSTIRQTIFIPGKAPAVPFTAHTDKPWATVAPSSSILGPDGVTLTIISDPIALKLGTNTATVILTFGAATKGSIIANDTTTPVSVPVSVTTVTPVTSGGKNTPLPNSLIIPAVGHAAGANDSLFESDIRIANTSAQAMKYQLNFTLTRTDASQSGSSTTIQVDPGSTMALDDILTSFFGTGSDGTSALGVLEIRPLTTASNTFSSPSAVSVQTVASSRTYNSTPTGTFGQFIPAIPFSSFIAQSTDSSNKIVLSLQQIAQSSAYRTNFGIVEGAGEPASVLVHVFNNQGVEVVAPIPLSLMPGEHQQRNLLAENGITLTDGRFEVEVVSPTGKVTAYASVIDNLTNDPLLVFPVLKGGESATRYVIPGVADINNGFASWRSDIRLFNPTSTPVTATLTYFPQPGNTGASGTKQVTIPAGQVMPIDNALQSLYTLTNSGGSMLVTTPSSSKLIVTARTYNQTSNGTYGQFIPAVTPAGSIGLSDNRVLQLLQLESSDKMRTNLGFVETSGSPVTIEVSAIPSDSKVAAKTQIPLAANQFLQVSLAQFGLGTAYNARVTVKVLSGTGRVTAYGSVIDAATQDPTYVPAQ
jgi:hypothetical protein